jgi:polyphosphate kinase
VRGIVDRFLEHSRIFHFHAGGKDEVYISSADWMPRNLYARIELLLPVLDGAVRKEVLAVLEAGLKDNVKAAQLSTDGVYAPYAAGNGAYRSQVELYKRACKAASPPAPKAPAAQTIYRRRPRPGQRSR